MDASSAGSGSWDAASSAITLLSKAPCASATDRSCSCMYLHQSNLCQINPAVPSAAILEEQCMLACLTDASIYDLDVWEPVVLEGHFLQPCLWCCCARNGAAPREQQVFAQCHGSWAAEDCFHQVDDSAPSGPSEHIHVNIPHAAAHTRARHVYSGEEAP